MTKPTRNQIPDSLKWDLSPIFATEDEFDKVFAQAQLAVSKYASFKGRLKRSAKSLLAALKFDDEVNKMFDRLEAFAYLKVCEDISDELSRTRLSRFKKLDEKLSEERAFINQELSTFKPERLEKLVASEAELSVYRQKLHGLISRGKRHARSEEFAKVLRQTDGIRSAPLEIFQLLTTQIIPRQMPLVMTDDGTLVQLDTTNYSRHVEGPNREVRRQAWEGMHRTYEDFGLLLATTYSRSVDAAIFEARGRKYSSVLEMELSPTNVPVSVYDNLITTVRANLPSLHRYMALRKRHMGLDELHLYDLNVPLIGGFDDNADLEEGKQAIVQALKVLGPDYSSDVEELFASRRIDYMPHENKQDGGFCFNRRGLKSYILLNFAGKFRDISNLAHEIGHDEHFKLAVSQEACYSRGSPYQFFCAEVASLVNEQLLAQQQVSRASDSKMRLYFLNRQLEDFRGIIIRTTMFAEFERRAYSIAEEGNQPLTLDVLNNLYVQLNKDYFGESVIVDKLVGHEWSRMHHLYYPFYLYTYATGLASAIAIADRILTEGQPAVDAYLGFLSDGNSKYALDSLRDIGVDLSTPAPIERAFKYFESVLDIFERELLAIEK